MQKLKELQITPKEELIELIKTGHIFEFCFLYAFNMGFGNISKTKSDVSFAVGDYEIQFNSDKVYFLINHKQYPLRMIMAGYYETTFIGESSEAIEDLLLEFQKHCKSN